MVGIINAQMVDAVARGKVPMTERRYVIRDAEMLTGVVQGAPTTIVWSSRIVRARRHIVIVTTTFAAKRLGLEPNAHLAARYVEKTEYLLRGQGRNS